MSNPTRAEARRRPVVPALAGLLFVSVSACSDDPTGVAPTAAPVVSEVVTSEDLLPSCGVGFWKNHADPEIWSPTGYGPDAAVGSVFNGAEPWHELTLLDALELGGGPGLDGARAILLRAAVAALLNAAHPGVAYGMTGVEVVGAVEAAFASGKRKDMIDLAGALDLLNDGSCALAPEEPDEPEEPGLPDLIVSAIVFGDATETSLPRTATIKNEGTAPVDVEGVVVQGYYSDDTQLDLGVDDPACGRVASTTSLILDPGETVDVMNNCSPPDAGFNYLLIVVDRADAIVESDETNNIGSIAVPRPDLVVSLIVFGDANETNLPRTATIKNQGTAPVDVEGVVVQGYYSTDTEFDAGVDDPACGRVASTTSLILDPGETVDVTNNCSPPGGGFHHLLIVVDRADAIVESDETNNVGVIDVPAGD